MTEACLSHWFSAKRRQVASPHVVFSKALWYCLFGKYGLLETKDSQEKKNNLIYIIIWNLIWGWEDILRSMVVMQWRESEINKLALMSALIRILFSAAEAEWSGTAQLWLCCTTACGVDKTRETSQCLALKVGRRYWRLFQMCSLGIWTNSSFLSTCKAMQIFLSVSRLRNSFKQWHTSTWVSLQRLLQFLW